MLTFVLCTLFHTDRKRQLCSVSGKEHREDNLLYGTGPFYSFSGTGATGDFELPEAGTGNGTQVHKKSVTLSLQPISTTPFQTSWQASKNQCLT